MFDVFKVNICYSAHKYCFYLVRISVLPLSLNKSDNKASCQPAYAWYYANGHARLRFASPCPCNRVHQEELSSVGINPTQPQALDIYHRKDTTNCLLTQSCHLYTQQSPRRWFFQFPFTLRSRRERHKSTGKWWVSGSPHSRIHLFTGRPEL